MKKVMVLLLILSLLFSASAYAAERPTVRIQGSYDGEYWKENGIKTSTPNYHWKTGLTLLRLDNAPDLYETYSTDCDIRALKDAGALADLSSSEILREAVSRMRPEIQELISDEAGHIYAMPEEAWSSPVYWHQEAFDEAGLTEADVPQSYTELLDFAERWAERVKDHPEKNVCFADTFFGGNASYCFTWWLTEILINTWEMQAYEAGEPLDFDTPEFLALLKRTREVGKLLRKAEPSQKKRQIMMQLFYSGGSESRYNGGRDYGLSHTVPFRITAEQPALMRASINVNMARAGSEVADLVIGYLEHYVPSEKYLYSVELYREGVAPGDYVAPPSSKKDDGKRITAGWIKDRNEYTGKFSFAPMRTFFLYEDSLMKFIKGELSAEKLVEKISVPRDDPNT